MYISQGVTKPLVQGRTFTLWNESLVFVLLLSKDLFLLQVSVYAISISVSTNNLDIKDPTPVTAIIY